MQKNMFHFMSAISYHIIVNYNQNIYKHKTKDTLLMMSNQNVHDSYIFEIYVQKSVLHHQLFFM